MKKSIFRKIKHFYPSLTYSEFSKIKKRFTRYEKKIESFQKIDPSYETYAYFRGLSEGRISINEQIRSNFLGIKPTQGAFDAFKAEVRTEAFLHKHPEMAKYLSALKEGKISVEEFYDEIDAFKKTRTYANRGGS